MRADRAGAVGLRLLKSSGRCQTALPGQAGLTLWNSQVFPAGPSASQLDIISDLALDATTAKASVSVVPIAMGVDPDLRARQFSMSWAQCGER
jgi:hypothetical protein